EPRIFQIPEPSSGSSPIPETASRAGVALSDDGRRVATVGDEDKIVWSWNADQPSLPPQPYLDSESRSTTSALAFSPDGGRLAAAGDDQVVRVWDVGGPKDKLLKLRLDRPVSGRGGRILALAFSRDGHRLAAGGEDQVASIWNLERPELPPL